MAILDLPIDTYYGHKYSDTNHSEPTSRRPNSTGKKLCSWNILAERRQCEDCLAWGVFSAVRSLPLSLVHAQAAYNTIHIGKNPPSCWFFLLRLQRRIRFQLLFVDVCTVCVRIKLYSLFFWCTEPGCRTSTHPRSYAMACERTRAKIREPHFFLVHFVYVQVIYAT